MSLEFIIFLYYFYIFNSLISSVNNKFHPFTALVIPSLPILVSLRPSSLLTVGPKDA